MLTQAQIKTVLDLMGNGTGWEFERIVTVPTGLGESYAVAISPANIAATHPAISQAGDVFEYFSDADLRTAKISR